MWIWTMSFFLVRQRSKRSKKFFFWCGDKFVQLFHMLLLNKNGCVWKWYIPQTLPFKWGKWCCVVVETCFFLQDLGGTKDGVSDEVDVNRPAPGRMFPVKTLFLEDALVPWTEIDESPSNHGWFFLGWWKSYGINGGFALGLDLPRFGSGWPRRWQSIWWSSSFQLAVPPSVATEQVPSTVERETAVRQSWRKV